MNDKSWKWTVVVLMFVVFWTVSSLVAKTGGKTEAEIISYFKNGIPHADFEREVGKPVYVVLREKNDQYYYLSVDGSLICVQINNKTRALSTHFTKLRYYFLPL